MQLYNFKTIAQNKEFIERVELAGYDGIAVTIDTPIGGLRRADSYSNFSMPPHLKYKNMEKLA